MKPTLDCYVERLANWVSPRQWILFPLLVAAPLLFTAVSRYLSGKDSSADIGDYAAIGIEMAMLAGIALYLLRVIAKRFKMVQAFQEGDTRYRQLFDVAPEPMVVHRQGKILLVNAAAARAVEADGPQDMIGKSVFEFIATDHRAAAEARFKAVESRRSEVPLIEINFLKSDGRVAYGEALALPTTFEGQPAVLSMGRDITERKLAEEALKESERKYRLLVENAYEGIFVAQNGMFRFVNSRVAQATEYSPEELLQKPFIELVYPEDREETLFYHSRRMAGEGIPMRRSFRVVTRTGKVRWIELESVLITWDGKPASLCFTTDITDKKMAEESLKESQRRYQDLVENANDIIYMADANGFFLIFNPVGLRVTGYSQDEILRKHYLDLIHPDYKNEAERFYGIQFVKRIPDTYYELPIITKQGETIWIGQKVQLVIQRDTVAGFQAICRDITDRKKTEQERENLKEQLLHAQKMEAIGTLTGGIAHEFNNLLTIVSGYTELLLAEKGADGPMSSDLRKIASACRRGADLIQKLRIFSRKAEYEFRPINLNNEVKDAVKLLSKTIPKMIAIQCDLADDLSVVRADSAQMGQLIVSLALNGQDAMPEGGKLLIETRNVTLSDEYCVSHVGARPGDYVLLTVADTGHGMDEATRQRIFEPFFTTRGLAQKSGLGLSVVHGIVEKHGGHIYCESAPGAGTTFKICLPAMHLDVERQDPVAETLIRAWNETVLLIDDEELITDLGHRILTRAGYTVLVASNGKDAADLYKANKEVISLVILDLVMPGMGGKQCLQELLRIDPMAKVLIATGYSDSAKREDLIAAGAKGFVTKPFTLTQLLRDVREILDSP